MTNVPEALLSARAVWVLAHLEWCIDSCPQGMDSRSHGIDSCPHGIDSRSHGTDSRPHGIDSWAQG
jgi:hypothetical protein